MGYDSASQEYVCNRKVFVSLTAGNALIPTQSTDCDILAKAGARIGRYYREV